MRILPIIAILLGGGYLALKATQKAKTAENLFDKLKYSYSNIRLSLKNGVVTLKLNVSITNLSGISIPVENIMVQAQYLKDNIFKDLAYTKNSVSKVVIEANATSTISDITLDASGGLLIWNAILALVGKITQLKIVTSYYVAGFQQFYEEVFPIDVKKITGTQGLGEEIIELSPVKPVSEGSFYGLTKYLS